MDVEAKTKYKRRFITAVIIIAAVIGAILLSGIIYFLVDRNHSVAERERYYQLADNDTESLFEISNSMALASDKKAYEKFEKNCLGNENSILLSFGCYCEKGGFTCMSGDTTTLTKNKEKNIISKFPASYINIVNAYVYFRDDMTKGIYRYSIAEKKAELIVAAPTGQMIVSKKGISYIDAASATLNHIQFDTMESSRIIDDQVKSFAVIGDSYYCLKENKDFGIITKDGYFDLIATNVDRFFCKHSIVVQKRDNIYVINEGTIKSELLGIKGIVVGFSRDEIYIYENQCINAYSISKSAFDRTVVKLKDGEIIKCFYDLNDTYEIIVFSSRNSLYEVNRRTIAKQY